ncbi:MAG: MFS transporter [Deltaproteobacteria bacterium]|nr:MFS transporter [Deltaproteobacteria bacterium]
MNTVLKNSFTRFLIMDALFEGGRMFVGAISIAYLLQSNINLKQIAILKSIQALTIILGEIPTGVLADLFGRKRSLELAVFTSIIGFFLYYSGGHFAFFIAGEILTAIGLCFWSGAYEAFAIDRVRLESEPGLLDRFFHLNQAINSAAVLFFGGLGGYIGGVKLNFPYIAAIIVFIILAVLLYQTDRDYPRKPIAAIAPSTSKSNKLWSKLLPYFLANVGIQLLIQPMLHYWQPYFQTFGNQIGPKELGWIFSSYCGLSIIFGMVYARYSKQKCVQSYQMTVILFLCSSLIYYVFSIVKTWQVGVILFALLQATLSVARTSLGARLNEKIPTAFRASVLSMVSLFSRFGMIGSLAVLSKFTDPVYMFLFFSEISLTIMIVGLCVLIIFIAFRKKCYA